MARGMDFWKPKLGEYTDPSSLCLCQYPPEVHATGCRSAEQSIVEQSCTVWEQAT